MLGNGLHHMLHLNRCHVLGLVLVRCRGGRGADHPQPIVRAKLVCFLRARVQETNRHISADAGGPRGIDLGDHRCAHLVSDGLLISRCLGGLGQQVQRSPFLCRSQKLGQRQCLDLLSAPCQLLLVVVAEKQRMGSLALGGVHGGGSQVGGQQRTSGHQSGGMRHPEEHGVNRWLTRRNGGLNRRSGGYCNRSNNLSEGLQGRQRLSVFLGALYEPLAELAPRFVPTGWVLPGEPSDDRLGEVSVQAVAHPADGLGREHVLLRNRVAVLHTHRGHTAGQLQGLLHRLQPLQRLGGGLGAHAHQGALLQLHLRRALVSLGDGAQPRGNLQATTEEGDVLHGCH
mmetsp:Transcript_50550/g.110618  ORF Transcript_50550/g.110618 Transcript_50550/m.110618 type:complete len:342 (-) Transcript_50550:625-1650(-)